MFWAIFVLTGVQIYSVFENIPFSSTKSNKNFSPLKSEKALKNQGFLRRYLFYRLFMAGVERFELPNDGVRVRSLTAWRYPNTCPQHPKPDLRFSVRDFPYEYILYYTAAAFCKCFEAVSLKFSNFFAPSRKLRKRAAVSNLASCAPTAVSPKNRAQAFVTS